MRRSPSKSIATLHAAPRLACVKPIASVHPEPGSNSSLFYFFSFFFFSLCSESVLPYQVLPFLTVAFLILVLLVDYVTLSKISLLSQLKRIALPSIAAAKVDTLSFLSKYFCSFFWEKVLKITPNRTEWRGYKSISHGLSSSPSGELAFMERGMERYHPLYLAKNKHLTTHRGMNTEWQRAFPYI